VKTNEEVRIASGRNRNLVWDLDESPMGEGTIEASVGATDCHPLVDLTMRWVGLHEQPECWEIQWCHHPDYIRDELPDYLRQFCPVPNEMVRALQELGLEDFPTLDDFNPEPEEAA
jgi:hypothetical protein